MNQTLKNLSARGFFQQCTDVEKLSALMDVGGLTFYEGCDPTGASLHIGHMVPYFAVRHLVEAGNTAIILVGGGTARIGDPSGKTSMRRMVSYEQINANVSSIMKQIERFFSGIAKDKIIYENNEHWLADLNYIDFLREIGSHFSVNRMLSFDAYKTRLESDTGLSFIEFNYQLLQSYDFYQLYQKYGCRLQIGGNDQWGNITAGADLVRRLGGDEVFGLTFPLVTTSDGKKMGKTEQGAVFLDPSLTTPYDFFQYWRNVQDTDVRRFLLMFTFLPVEECHALTAPSVNPNEAKERLAWEVTALIHGKDEADKALAGAKALFGGGGDASAMPTVKLPRSRFESGIAVTDVFVETKLCATKSDARRLIQQGGAFAGGSPDKLMAFTDPAAVISADALDADGGIILRAGKKRYCKIQAE